MKEILSFETIRIRNVLKDTKPVIYVADGCEDLSLGWDDVPSCHICKCRGSYYVSDEGRKSAQKINIFGETKMQVQFGSGIIEHGAQGSEFARATSLVSLGVLSDFRRPHAFSLTQIMESPVSSLMKEAEK